MKIVKKESGAVLLRDNANSTFQTLYTGNAKVLVGGTGDFVRVFQDQRKKVDIFTVDVIAYQIEPAAEIAFAGTTAQLADILAEMLDLEVCCPSAGGGDIGANFIELEEIAEPATPGADKIRIWTEDLNGISVLKYKTSSGIVLQFLRDNVLVVRNVSGGNLLRGQLVYFAGSTGTRPTVALANASLPGNVPARGILLADVANNGYVFAMTAGFISALDTSAFSDGDVLYTSASVAGGITNVAPSSPNFRQTIGVCIRSHPNMGSIEIDFGSIQEQVFTDTKNGLVPASGGGTLNFLRADGSWVADVLTQSGSKLSATASGTNTYTATITPAIAAYLNTHRFFIRFTNANTGASTLNLNGLGAVPIVRNNGNALTSGDILAGGIYVLAYDGTNFRLITPSRPNLVNGNGTTFATDRINLGGAIDNSITYTYSIDQNELHILPVQSSYTKLTRKVNTTNGTSLPLTVFSYTVPAGECVGFRVVCLGHRTDSTGLGRFESKVRYVANEGGTLSAPATATDFLSQNYAIAWDIVTVGTTVNINITTGGGNIDWLFTIELYKTNK